MADVAEDPPAYRQPLMQRQAPEGDEEETNDEEDNGEEGNDEYEAELDRENLRLVGFFLQEVPPLIQSIENSTRASAQLIQELHQEIRDPEHGITLSLREIGNDLRQFTHDFLPQLLDPQRGAIPCLFAIQKDLAQFIGGELVFTTPQKLTVILNQIKLLVGHDAKAADQRGSILEILQANQAKPLMLKLSEDLAEQHRQAVEQREDILKALEALGAGDDEAGSPSPKQPGSQQSMPSLEVIEQQNKEIIDQNRQALEQRGSMLQALSENNMTPPAPQGQPGQPIPGLDVIERQNIVIIAQNQDANSQRTKILKALQNIGAPESRASVAIPDWRAVIFWTLWLMFLVVLFNFILHNMSPNSAVEWEEVYKSIAAQLASSKPDWMSLLNREQDGA